MTRNRKNFAWLLVVLPIGLFVWLFHGEILWVALRTDYFMKVSGHGYACSDNLANTPILIAIYTGVFFVCAAMYGFGHAIEYAEASEVVLAKKGARSFHIKIASGIGLSLVFGVVCVLALMRMC